MSTTPSPSRWAIATHRAVVWRALRLALVVGPILTAINHGDAIARQEWSSLRTLQVALTFLVPYVVSTVSSVGALRSKD